MLPYAVICRIGWTYKVPSRPTAVREDMSEMIAAWRPFAKWRPKVGVVLHTPISVQITTLNTFNENSVARFLADIFSLKHWINAFNILWQDLWFQTRSVSVTCRQRHQSFRIYLSFSNVFAQSAVEKKYLRCTNSGCTVCAGFTANYHGNRSWQLGVVLCWARRYSWFMRLGCAVRVLPERDSQVNFSVSAEQSIELDKYCLSRAGSVSSTFLFSRANCLLYKPILVPNSYLRSRKFPFLWSQVRSSWEIS